MWSVEGGGGREGEEREVKKYNIVEGFVVMDVHMVYIILRRVWAIHTYMYINVQCTCMCINMCRIKNTVISLV